VTGWKNGVVLFLIFVLLVILDVTVVPSAFGTLAGAISVVVLAVVLTAIFFILWKKGIVSPGV